MTKPPSAATTGREGRGSIQGFNQNKRGPIFSDVEEFLENEFLPDEERDMIVFAVRDKIINQVVDAQYKVYMKSQEAPFAAHCFEKALKQLLNWYYQSKDKSDTPKDWDDDVEPPPVPIDSWASFNSPVTKEEPIQTQKSQVKYPSEKGSTLTASTLSTPKEQVQVTSPEPESGQVQEEEKEAKDVNIQTSFTSLPSPQGVPSSLKDLSTTLSNQTRGSTTKEPSKPATDRIYVRGTGGYIDPKKFPSVSFRFAVEKISTEEGLEKIRKPGYAL